MRIKLTFLFIFCMAALFGNAMNSEVKSTDSTLVNELLAQRASLIVNHKSIREIDQKLANLGYLPTALVNKSSEGSSFVFVFEYYKNITNENQEKIASRLKSTFPGLSKIEFDLAKNSCKAEFSTNTGTEEINSFFLIFGYKGYEIK